MFAAISLQQLERMLDQGYPMLLVDLRTEDAYEKSHLAGAIHIPYDQLAEEDLEAYRDTLIVFYCEHGGKSMRAARDFGKKGFRAASLGSGIGYYRGKYLVSGQNFIDR